MTASVKKTDAAEAAKAGQLPHNPWDGAEQMHGGGDWPKVDANGIAPGEPEHQGAGPVLEALPETASLDEVRAALIEWARSLDGAPPLDRAVERLRAVAALKRVKAAERGAAALVDSSMPPAPGAASAPVGTDLLPPEPPPWEDTPDGSAVLSELVETLRRFVVFPSPSAAVAAALWCFFAHAIEAFDVAPILALTSPEKRCGKSTLKRMLHHLVPRAIDTVNISSAALFRTIEIAAPTLLIDEGDSFLAGNEELRGLLNAGHTRGEVAIRLVGDDHEPRGFKLFGAKVLARIGRLSGTWSTVEDRSIVLHMRRQAPGERAEKIRGELRLQGLLTPLRRKLARWAQDHLQALRDARPDVPEALNDRAADNWTPLLAVADAIGGAWPETARRAALELSGAIEEEAGNPRVQLLADLRACFREAGNPEQIATKEILHYLHGLDERPWSDWRGKPLSARALGTLLAHYRVHPAPQWREGEGDRTKWIRGYARAAFEDTWRRYLPSEEEPSGPRHPAPAPGGGLRTDTSDTAEGKPQDPHPTRPFPRVSDANPAPSEGSVGCVGSNARGLRGRP